LKGERIVVITDRKHLQDAQREYPGMTIYCPEEIDDLYRIRGCRDLIGKVHWTKKHLGAWVVPQDSPLGQQMRMERDNRQRVKRALRSEARHGTLTPVAQIGGWGGTRTIVRAPFVTEG
jgi:hypothetical protein